LHLVSRECELIYFFKSSQTTLVPAMPWASKAFTKSCKHETINQLLGLIQRLKNEIKFFFKNQPRHWGTGSA
jgi:hypothetical protein